MSAKDKKKDKKPVTKAKPEIEKLRNKLIPILKEGGVEKAALFGSFAKGKMRESSDYDILVKINKEISLLDFVRLKLELEDALGKKVDLVEYDTIKPRLRDRILKEQVVIL